MEPISREDVAWMAGIIDGEGCISVSVNNNVEIGKYRLSLDISNTSPHLLEKLSKVWSRLGVVYCYAFNCALVGKEQLHIMVQSYGAVKTVLDAALPYLSAKREEAQLVLDFISWRKAELPERFGGSPSTCLYTRVLRERYAALYEALKACKRRCWHLQRLPRHASTPLDLAGLEAKV